MMVVSKTLTNRFWLCHNFDNDPIEACPEALQAVRTGDWWTVLRNPIFATILRQCLANEQKITNPDVVDDHNVETTFALAIAAVQCFVLENFLGPRLDEAAYAELPHYALLHDGHTDMAQLLHSDGEEINVNVTRPELLLVAKRILEQLIERADAETVTVWPIEVPLIRWWYLRCLYIHQQILDEHTDTLYTAFGRHSAALLEWPTDSETGALLRLEIVQGYLAYRRAWHAQSHLEEAKQLLGIELTVQGFLGKRTKWQQKALPQLALRVTATDDAATATELAPVSLACETHADGVLPTLLRLDDDTRLERVTFESTEDNRTLELSALVQQLVLGMLEYLIRSQPKDTLADEELTPFITTLIYQTNGPWASRITTLLLNIQLESTHKRTVERSLKQCEEVAHLLSTATTADVHPDASATPAQRLSLAHSSYLRPRWLVQSQLGALMISLGMIKTALDLYLQLREWPAVIECYTVLELRHKAAEIIEQQLAQRPTVELYCLLGDATDDPQHYERAWELSKQRSGRAQRHWGSWHFARKDYAAAIPHLQRSLALNSLQEITWARLGYAALQLENWELAAEAYRRYTTIEPNGFECWNNLCKAYVNMGDKRRAHKVLEEALKCNFGNWKVWENYLLVSVDTGHFDDALNAYNQLIELRGKYFDAQVLGIVCRAVAADVPDADGRPGGRLLRKAQKLIGHMGVQQPGEPLVWELAALLHEGEPLVQAQSWQKAFRCGTQTRTEAQWSKDPVAVGRVLELCERLCETSIAAWHAQTAATRAACAAQLSSARLSVQGAVRAALDEKWEEHQATAQALEGRLAAIKEILLNK